jgi:hypothetical protein
MDDGARRDAVEEPSPARDGGGPLVKSAVPSQAHYADAVAEIHRWTSEAMTAPDVPVFGSARWCALADDDPAKTYAAARAALAWWAGQDRAADEAARDHVASSHAISASVEWTTESRVPSHQELVRRRGA